MEFGHVTDPTRIQFALPPDPPGNARVLTGLPRIPTTWYTGLTGWREPAWKGDLYASSCKPAQFLSAYAESFNCVELNATFYHVPAPRQIQKWVDAVPAHFRFCPKVWQGLSHDENIAPARTIEAIQSAHAHFGDRLGPAFIQFPPRIGRTHLDWILAILDHWSAEQELFIEVRDPRLLQEEGWISRLEEQKVGLVITDVAGHRELAHMNLTIPKLMLRFVATGDTHLDRPRMIDWLTRLRLWGQTGLRESWIFLHHASNAQAPAVARLWADCIKECDDSFISMQTPVHYRPNPQGNLFDQV